MDNDKVEPETTIYSSRPVIEYKPPENVWSTFNTTWYDLIKHLDKEQDQ